MIRMRSPILPSTASTSKRKLRAAGFFALFIVWILWISPARVEAGPAFDTAHRQLPVLRMAFSRQLFREISAEDGLAATHVWLQALGKNSAIFQSSKTMLVDNLESIVRAGNQHRFDLLLVPAAEYVRLEKRIPLTPWFTYLRGGRMGQQMVLLGQREKVGEPDLESLNGRSLSIAGGESTELITLWLETLLMDHKLPPMKQFFASVATVNKPSQAVLPVFFGQRDACAISREAFDLICELNPQVSNKLAIVENSPPLMPVVLCAHRNSDSKLMERMRAVMATAHQDPWAKQIFITFRIEKLEAFDPALFENVKALVKRFEARQEALSAAIEKPFTGPDQR